MQLGVATEIADVPLDAAAWNAIVEQCPTNTVFQTFEWFDAWWRAFGNQHLLYFVWVKEGDRCIAFAPLMMTAGSHGLRKLEIVGSGNADYLDFFYARHKPDLLAAMLRFLQQRSDWDVLHLANLPMHSSSFAQLPALVRECGLNMLHEATAICPTLILKDRADQARAMIDKYSVRRKANWFGKRGKVEVRHLTDVADIDAHLDAFFAQHVQRWTRSGTLTQFERPNQREFFRGLVKSLGARGALVFTVILLDAEPLAYHFGFCYGDRLVWYKPAFNERYSGRSPGLVLMRCLIEEALRIGKDEFDYTVGAEEFKFRFSNVVRANAYLSIYHARSRHTIAVTLHTLRSIARWLLRPFYTAWRATMARLRQSR